MKSADRLLLLWTCCLLALVAAVHSIANDPPLAHYGLVVQYSLNGHADAERTPAMHGTLEGATAIADRFGRTIGAIYFDGVDDQVTIEDELFVKENQLTVSLWIHMREPASGLSYFVDAKRNGFGLWCDQENEQYRLGLAIHLPSTRSADGLMVYNRWYHFVGTYNGNRISAYINGRLVETTLHLGTLAFWDGPLTLGSFHNVKTGTRSYWQGSLDDIQLYNYALSTDEVQALYKAQRIQTSVGLQGWGQVKKHLVVHAVQQARAAGTKP